MPLLDRNLQAEATQALQVVNERFESRMTLRVKLAVLEELIDSFLLSAFEHLLKESESDLSNEQLVMVPVMAVHLGTLP